MARKVEDYFNDYKTIGKDPENIKKLPYLGDHEIAFYIHSFKRADKETDPVNKHKMIMEVYNHFKRQVTSWYIGHMGAKPSESDEYEDDITNGEKVLEEMFKK